VWKSNSVLVKISGDGRNVISVPVRSPASPVTFSGSTGSPRRNSISCTLPSRQMRSLSHSDSAFTTETPTPCRPPETL